MFIAKYDTDGNVLWARKASGATWNNDFSIAADSSGNVYVTGSFSDTATFDSTILASIGESDIFIAKYDTDGNVLWVRQSGGSMADLGYGIAVDLSGNVYVTGFFQDMATFDSTSLASVGGYDIFIAKYDTDGNVLWVRQSGSSINDYGQSIAADSSGNVYITGFFQDTATFDSTSLTSIGESDIFIAKYDTDGNVVWVRKAGSSNWDKGYGIAVDSVENVYVTGFFQDTATFGTTSITGSGGTEMFITKLDSRFF